jgi:peptide/nickel transport system ATP-binding protein
MSLLPVPLLSVDDLSVTLESPRGPLEVLRRVGFTLERGHMLGIVGESGSGKTMTALTLIGLLPEGARATGAVRLDGRDLLALPEAELCRLRGERIAMVFQEPMTALNPLQTIGHQVAEPLRLHRGAGGAEALAEAVRLLDRVRLPAAAQIAASYPHMLSGGQRQRAVIAMALACGPDLLIADEPTSALDVTVQSRILDLLVELVAEKGMALILVSHDLAAVAETVDEVLVLYGGTVVEYAPVAALAERPAHPYTQGLFAARPSLGEQRAPRAIPGTVPELAALPPGCRFADRCTLAVAECSAAPPALREVGPIHRAACIRLDAARERSGRSGP